MNLTEAKQLTSLKKTQGYRSDGCTFVPESIFHNACVLHDTLLRFGGIHRIASDNLFLEYMLTLADKRPHYVVLAYIYYVGVRLASMTFYRGQ